MEIFDDSLGFVEGDRVQLGCLVGRVLWLSRFGWSVDLDDDDDDETPELNGGVAPLFKGWVKVTE